MANTNSIYSLSISARAIFDMHSLNNEGGEGNQIQTRMVNIIGADNQMHNVNAISGDMFKHIQAEHLHRLAVEAGLPLSEGARQFNANRVNYDIQAKNELLKALDDANGDAAELDVILQRCAVTDMEGILVTAGNRSLPRKSVVEFGWVVGVPGSVETDSYFHVKYASDRSEKARTQAESEESRGAVKSFAGKCFAYVHRTGGRDAEYAESPCGGCARGDYGESRGGACAVHFATQAGVCGRDSTNCERVEFTASERYRGDSI